MVLTVGIEPTASSLPRKCSTPEPRQLLTSYKSQFASLQSFSVPMYTLRLRLTTHGLYESNNSISNNCMIL